MFRNQQIKQKYNFIAQIGSGASSKVYKVNSKQQKHKIFAVKKICYNKPGNLAIIKSEIKWLRKLSHPNIIKLYEIFHNIKKSCVYLIIDYLPYDLITYYKLFQERNKKSLPDQHIKHIFYQVCLAIEYLHKRHLMHRDIKPENILIDPINIAKKQYHVLLIDFGYVRQSSLHCTLTPYIFTRWYRPLEVALQLPYNESSDIFSLGAVLLELYNGSEIFKSQSNIQQIYLICKICGYPNWDIAIQKLNRLGLKFNLFNRPKIFMIIKNLPKDAGQVIIGTLDSIPQYRITISDILYSKYFESINPKLSNSRSLEMINQINSKCFKQQHQQRKKKHDLKFRINSLQTNQPFRYRQKHIKSSDAFQQKSLRDSMKVPYFSHQVNDQAQQKNQRKKQRKDSKKKLLKQKQCKYLYPEFQNYEESSEESSQIPIFNKYIKEMANNDYFKRQRKEVDKFYEINKDPVFPSCIYIASQNQYFPMVPATININIMNIRKSDKKTRRKTMNLDVCQPIQYQKNKNKQIISNGSNFRPQNKRGKSVDVHRRYNNQNIHKNLRNRNKYIQNQYAEQYYIVPQKSILCHKIAQGKRINPENMDNVNQQNLAGKLLQKESLNSKDRSILSKSDIKCYSINKARKFSKKTLKNHKNSKFQNYS